MTTEPKHAAPPVGLVVTHAGVLSFEETDEARVVGDDVAGRVRRAAGRGTGAGLAHLATRELASPLSPSLAFGRALAKRYMKALSAMGEAARERELGAPLEALAGLLEELPPIVGAEYATLDTLARAWRELDECVRVELERHEGTVHSYLQRKNPAWHALGRVTFHVAEQKSGAALPFAFLATFAEDVSASGRPQYVPLARALEALRGRNAELLALLRPVHEAGRRNATVRAMTDSGALFRPLAWTADETYAFLCAVPDCEAAGIAVRLPDWWSARRRRVQASAQLGSREASGLGMESLLDFDARLSLDGERLTADEERDVLAGARGLRLLHGRWVEVDPERLREAVARFASVAERAASGGIGLVDGLRLLAGADDPAAGVEAEERTPAWSEVRAGPWLEHLLRELSSPDASLDPGPDFRGTLRPYQQAGVAWVTLLARLQLGGCLADDMGLGKTVQVLAAFATLARQGFAGPHLVVVPTSLLGNWQAELERFLPSARFLVAHRSAHSAEELRALEPRDGDLVLTTYGTLPRLEALRSFEFGLCVLDEAQAIKNPGTRQAKSVKGVRCRARLALTGTPIENRLTELWSLFDFLCPGLLGSAREFGAYARELAAEARQGFGPLRRLLRPYLLRRMKTDASIVPDLPDKTVVPVSCGLGKVQVALYEEAVLELRRRLEAEDPQGIERRGIVLATLSRLKQICNHPSQWTGDGVYAPEDSGKFLRLAELCETIAARQERALVFTQYRELTEPLAAYLAALFGRAGAVLHGGTPVKRRTRLVEEFQRDDGPPFLVLSLKAGGTGLNLTGANHVVHFDRWWNPAVENQATDRAYRIGQHRNVLVHTFTCRGTVEEQIEEMLLRKEALAEEILAQRGEAALTELSSDELLRVLSLDVRRARG